MSHKDNIRRLIIEHRRRLQKLEEQKARFGISTPPEVLLEIEDIKIEIEQLEAELKTLEDSARYEETIQEGKKEDPAGVRQAKTDWGDAPDVYSFFGREHELQTLEQWILYDKCRLVTIIGLRGVGKTVLSVKLGKGGIGKTDLSLKFAYGIKEKFEYVIWRKLLNAPPLEEILSDLIKFFSNQAEVHLPDKPEEQIERLLTYLRNHRCLIILDNVESVLQGGENAGQYQNGYEDYGLLFQRIGLASHNSCLILTTREKPVDIVKLEGKNKPVRSLNLAGLDTEAARKIFLEIDSFEGTEREWEELVKFYNGNPLALELAAKHIQEVFFGDVSAFLKEGRPIFDDLNDLLDWHFNRLNPFEKEIMYWLAINREPMNLSEIRSDLISYESKQQLTSTLQSLQHKLPLERSQIRFTLQPVLMGYMTLRLIEQVNEEIRIAQPEVSNLLVDRVVEKISAGVLSGNLDFFDNYALLKAMAKDFVRESQARLIINPVIEELSATLGNIQNVEAQLKRIIKILKTSPHLNGYGGGNVLNILRYMNVDLTGYDFSDLIVRQAYLQGINLHQVNFCNTQFINCLFTETFGSILAVAFSPDGKLLALGTANKEIRLYDLETEKQIATFKGHENWVWSVAFSPDSNMLASGSYDNTIRIWDISSGMCLKILEGHSNTVWAVAFSPDTQTLVSASSDTTLKLWDVSQGMCLKTFTGHHDWVRCAVFSPDGRMVISGGSDCKVRLWDIDSGECVRTYEGHNDIILAVAVNSEATAIASAGNDTTIRVWEVQSGRCTQVLSGHSNMVRSLAFSPDDNFLVSGSSDATIRIWDLNSKKCIKTLSGHHNWIMSLAISPDGKTIASGSSDWTLRFWDIQTGHLVRTFQGYTNSAWTVALSPDGNTLASGYADNSVRLWNVETRTCKTTWPGHNNWVMAVAFSSDGNTIASGSSDSTIRLWDLKTQAGSRVLKGHSNVVWTLDFHPSDSILASGSADKTIRLWNIRTDELKILKGHTGPVRHVFFRNDGLLASSSEDQTIRLWDIDREQTVSIFEGHNGPVWCVAFNLEGTLLTSGSGDLTIKVWDLKTGECIKTLEGHKDSVRQIRFNRNGQILVSASSDATLKVWDMATGKCIKTIEHESQLTSLAINYGKQLLVSSTDEGKINLWDSETMANLATLRYDRPYERMNIKDVKGLTSAQIDILKMLGAIEK